MNAVIAGGGLAGAAIACQLAQAGRAVTVIERTAGATHKICGEFLSIEAQDYLRRLGIDLPGLGGHSIGRVRLVRGARAVTAPLPFQAVGLTRHRLDEALLQHAVRLGAQVRRAETVTDMQGVTFLATGKHDMRGARREADAPEALVGFKMYFTLQAAETAALGDAVEVILFDDGYAGLQLVEDGRANLCLLVHRDRLARAGGWEALLDDLCSDSAHLRQRLEQALPLLERPLTIARVPYGFVHAAAPQDRYYRLGDQACVIPSFTGDGMALTLHSAALAGRHYLAGQTPFAYHKALARDVSGSIRRAEFLYRLGRSTHGQAWLMRAAGFWPGLLRLAAIQTRIPDRALHFNAA